MLKPPTYRRLKKWLDRLDPAQLDAPILLSPGADDYGEMNYAYVRELVPIAADHAEVSGSYQGPILLIGEQPTPSQLEPQDRDEWAELVANSRPDP